MMNFTELGKRLAKLAADNSPAILTAIAVSGTIATAVLATRAAFRVGKDVTDNSVYDNKALFKTYWREFIPAAATGCTTIVCIVMSTRIGTRRAAALASAYALTERAFEEYKGKVVEKMGERKERQVRDEIAQDRVTNNPPNEIVIVSGQVLCYETYTDRYFQSDMETIKQAVNRLNHNVLNNFYASLSDFYSYLGMKKTAISDDVGWNADKLLDVSFSTALAPDGRPCLAISYDVSPIKNYYRVS